MGLDFFKLADDARKGVQNAANAVGDAAGKTADAIGDTAGKVVEGAGEIAGQAVNTAGNAAGAIADGAVNVAGQAAEATSGAIAATGQAINDGISGIQNAGALRKAQEAEEIRRTQDEAKAKIEQDIAFELLGLLGDSPLYLDKGNCSKIKESFPVPREQTILWADAEFDLRPSGIAVTDRGVFIKSDVGVFDHLAKRSPEEGTSRLSYYRWEDFEAAWFVGDDESNAAMCVAEECRGSFISSCRQMAERAEEAQLAALDAQQRFLDEEKSRQTFEHAVGTAAMAPIADAAKYAHNHAELRNPAGHGEMVENAINMLDRAEGASVRWQGQDNAKGGADRIVNGISIQTKYYKTWRGSLDAAFDPGTGKYIYEGMQLEVPKDQYDKVVEGFRRKIEAGKVEGVSDPALAETFVRKGKLTYQQARNLTKPGTVESLAYDAGTGAIICSCAFGITFVATVFNTYRRTERIDESIQAGIVAGTQVFGTTFAQHVLSSQISRTRLADALIAPSQAIVQKMGYKATQTVVNGLRAIGGKSPIYGAAASKQLAKVLRGNAVTAAVTMVVFSVPETYRLATNKISGFQFAKNIGTLAGSVAGGAAGAVAAGAAASKVGAVVGTTITPGIGTAVGVAGGFVGGAVGSVAASTVGGIIGEDDAETVGRFFNAMVAVLACEYMLDGDEMSAVVEGLNKISAREQKDLYERLRSCDEQEAEIRAFLSPIFDEVVNGRKPFKLPDPEDIETAIIELAEDE